MALPIPLATLTLSQTRTMILIQPTSVVKKAVSKKERKEIHENSSESEGLLETSHEPPGNGRLNCREQWAEMENHMTRS